MVLPGIQALFGFQLIAVFNSGFSEKLNHSQQMLHLAALALVSLSTALILTPAAYQRVAEPGMRTSRFVSLSTRLLALSMVPLMLGLSLDFYLICGIILRDEVFSLIAAGLLLLIFAWLWLLMPYRARKRNLV